MVTGIDGRHFSFGSRASRRPSPTNTNASTVRKMAPAGKNSRWGALVEAALRVGHHQAPRRRGLLGPTPRNDSAASARMTLPTAIVP